ncbi:MAG: hypothetical protein HQL73_04160 [Magnetococcales bacterium]|nr:hypothetical protein [Magnetococcales bacterium]
MATSEKQRKANQENALKSTGPRTVAGKTASSLNAQRHGLFSSHVVLEDESPETFQGLVDDLHRSLQPVGALELALAEKVALTLWRGRRLARAETAVTDLERLPCKVAESVSRAMGLPYGNDLKETDLTTYDKGQAAWCRKVMKEYDALSELTLEELARQAPAIHRQLVEDAQEDEETPEAFVAAYDDGLTEYLHGLLRWCREELRKAEQRPRILALANQIRSKRAVLPERYLELLARYQTTLDNQLYKALKALREAQKWRLKTVEVEAISIVESGQEAALHAV